MKRIIFLITSLLLVSCYEEKFLSIPYMKGNLYSKEDNKPIVGADIYINHYLYMKSLEKEMYKQIRRVIFM